MIIDNIPEKLKYCRNYITVFLSDPVKFEMKYPLVWDAFIAACTAELSPSQAATVRSKLAKDVFTLGAGPLVTVSSKLEKNECGVFRAASPFFDYSYAIFISDKVADAYEYGTGWKVFEGLLLHESVHWVRYQAGATNPAMPRPGAPSHGFIAAGEVGDVFERAAYGFGICLEKNGRLLQIGPPGTEPARR
jgi:hypothetical protein